MAKKQQPIDIESLRDLVKKPDMVARILNPISRILGTPKDKLTDSQLAEFYREKLLPDIEHSGKYRGLGSGAVITLENYLLSKGLIDIPGYFAYLPVMKHEPYLDGRHKSYGMAELDTDGFRDLVYPIGIFKADWAITLHFGRRLDDVTELAYEIDGVNIEDIDKFRRLHSQISDSYNSKKYLIPERYQNN